MSAPGRVFSRTRILNQVWGYSEDPLTNVVDVYIARLRRKIDTPGREPLLETVRGHGYRLKASGIIWHRRRETLPRIYQCLGNPALEPCEVGRDR